MALDGRGGSLAAVDRERVPDLHVERQDKEGIDRNAIHSELPWMNAQLRQREFREIAGHGGGHPL